jgi:hypothetical protein
MDAKEKCGGGGGGGGRRRRPEEEKDQQRRSERAAARRSRATVNLDREPRNADWNRRKESK